MVATRQHKCVAVGIGDGGLVSAGLLPRQLEAQRTHDDIAAERHDDGGNQQ